MKKCPNCDRCNLDHAVFCNHCGNRLPVTTHDKLQTVSPHPKENTTPSPKATASKDKQGCMQGCIGFIGKRMVVILVIAAALIIYAYVSSIFDGQSSESNSDSHSTGKYTIAGENHIGCTDREYLNTIIKYAIQKDLEAFTMALNIGVLAETCKVFRDGDVVYLEDVAIYSGLVKIRPEGEMLEYWINTEAVE